MERIEKTSPLDFYEIASGATISGGDLVALDSNGKAIPAAVTSGAVVVGYAGAVVSGGVEVKDGIIALGNVSSGGTITRANRGGVAYVHDSATVTTSGGAVKMVAGIVVDVYDGAVMVDVRPSAHAAAAALAK